MAQTYPFPVDARLTGIFIAYQNPAGIADQILPRVPVATKEFRYMHQALDERLTVPETLVGRKSLPNEVEFTASERPGMVHDRGLDDVVPNDDILNAPQGYDPLGNAVEGVAELIELDREIRVAKAVLDANAYPAGNKTVVTEKWDDPTSNPIQQIMDQLEGPMVRPNVLVIPQPVWTKLRAHPRVIAAITPAGKTDGFATREQFASLLEVEQVLIGQGWRNSAKPGQVPTRVRIWSQDTVLAFYRNRTANVRRGVTFGMTAQWGSRVAGQIAEPKMGLRGSIRVRAGESVGELITCNDLAFLFQDVLTG